MSLFAYLLLACTSKPDSVLEQDDTACEAVSWFIDQDGDGYGAGAATESCEAPLGSVANDADCNDEDGSIHPDAEEVCNGLDDDCDGLADPEAEVGRVDCYEDLDGDGFGAASVSMSVCACPDGYTDTAGDCNDDDPDSYPGATETWYDGIDQDCGEDDDFDADGDGYQHEVDDCDDANPAVHPDAEEICGNGVDDDCDGLPGDCGLEGEVSSDDATGSVLDPIGNTSWTVGTATDDVDGDGQPELLLARHGDSSGDASRLEYHLVSLASSGERSLEEAAVASFEVTTDPDRWSTIGVQDTFGEVDLDGDGYADYLLGASNSDTTGLSPVSSRVYLQYGPAAGTVSLDGVSAAIATTADEWMGSRGIGFIEADGAGQFVVAAGVHRTDTAGRRPVVRFLGPEHFDGSAEVDSAPALWASAAEEATSHEPAAIRDIDGDGVGDVLLSFQDSTDPLEVRSYVFLGPVSSDIESGDADAVYRDDPEGRVWARALTACNGPSGDAWVVVGRWDAEDSDGFETHHRIHPWTGPGTYGDDTVQVEILEPELGGGVVSCGGDLDGDGMLEMVSNQESNSYEVEGGESLALVFEPPSEGVWELADVPHANLFVPDRDDPLWRITGAVLGTDFDGDSYDDLVYTTIIDPSGDGIGDQAVLFRYAGEPTGL